MTVYEIRFKPADDAAPQDTTIRAADDVGARQMAFLVIREHLAGELRDRGQIDLRGSAHIIDTEGSEIFAIDFAHAVGVVR